MRKIKVLLTLFLAAFLLINCSSDDDFKGEEPVPTPTPTPTPAPTIPPPSYAAFNAIRERALSDLIQKATFDAEEGIEFTSKEGVRLSIYPGGLINQKGEQISGEVELQFVEIFRRGDMLTANKPLMGRDPDGNLRPLITGGEFYVNVTQNGENVYPEYRYVLNVPAEKTGELNPGMVLWKGIIDQDNNLTWDEIIPMGNKIKMAFPTGTVFPDIELNEYRAYIGDFGWTNIDIFMYEEGDQTPLLVQVPEGFDNKNSSVYVAYKNQPGLLAFLDVYYPVEKLFSEHYGWAPVGYQMYVIFVTENEGRFVYSIREITVEKDKIITITAEELKTATKEELVSIINALP